MTIAWEDVELAIRTWVSTGTGIPLVRVIKSPASGPRPASPYAVVSLPQLTRVGRDWAIIDGLDVVHQGVRRATVSVQLHADPVVGASQSVALLERLISASELYAMDVILGEVNVALLDFGPVQPLAEVINQIKQDLRASLEVYVKLPSSISEPDGTFIEHVVVEAETSN